MPRPLVTLSGHSSQRSRLFAGRCVRKLERKLGCLRPPLRCPDLNTGKEWSKNDLFSLRNRIEHGRSVGHIATNSRALSLARAYR